MQGLSFSVASEILKGFRGAIGAYCVAFIMGRLVYPLTWDMNIDQEKHKQMSLPRKVGAAAMMIAAGAYTGAAMGVGPHDLIRRTWRKEAVIVYGLIGGMMGALHDPGFDRVVVQKMRNIWKKVF